MAVRSVAVVVPSPAILFSSTTATAHRLFSSNTATTTSTSTSTSTTKLEPTPDNDNDDNQHQEENHTPPESGSSLLPPLLPSSEADRLAALLLHHHNPFHPPESSLQLLHSGGVSLPPPLLRQTLLRLRRTSKIALALFLSADSHPDPVLRPDPLSYHILIDSLSLVRQFDVAWQLILQLDRSHHPLSSSVPFRILIRRLIAAGLTHQAVRAFDDIPSFVHPQQHQQPPAADDLCFLLDTLCKFRYPKVAMEVFNSHRAAVTPKMYTVLIDGWCKANNLGMAERLFREMEDLHGFCPNVVTYNVLLHGICRSASLHPEGSFLRTVRTAEKVFDEMFLRGIEPDVTSYSVLLHVYSRAHKPELTLQKLEAMKEKGICPTVATYTSVVKCLCSCGRLQDAESLLGEMESNGVSPTAATYNCFFQAYKERKDVGRALDLYRKMKAASPCLPSMHTYNVLVSMFEKLNRMELVKEIWDDMTASGAGPDLDSYTLMIHRLCDKRKWKAACRFFVEMIEKGFLPQKITFVTLYRGLMQASMLNTWRTLKKKLEEESITFGSEYEHYHFKPYRR